MTYIIAEIGVNHDGDINKAKKLVKVAKAVGADCAKFQIFITEDEMVRDTPKAKYQVDNGTDGDDMFEMCKALELTFAEFKRMKKYCDKIGIVFMASVFGQKELDFYVDDLGCRTVKFGSGELTNAPLLLETARKGAKVILSTGMSDLDDIEFALGVLAFGYTSKESPSNAAFKKAYKNPKGRTALKKNVVIMQCTTQYPCPDNAVNLRAMVTIANKFALPVGFSDHSEGLALAAASVGLGAVMIEKHFTLDRKMKGPDHKASLDPQQFRQYVEQIRSVEKGLGSGKKIVGKDAAEVAKLACRHIVARKEIRKGDKFTSENIMNKRTSKIGIPAKQFFDVVGKASKHFFERDDLIKL